jgi:PAS domain S-box-containing protein
LEASGVLFEKSRGAVKKPDHSWSGALELALAVAASYFLAARLGLALRPDSGVAAFWPAAGIAVGILLVLGPHARIPVAAGVVVATAVANVTAGRHGGLAVAFGFINAAHTLFTVWLIERWFGRNFGLEDVRQVLGLLVASAAGATIAAAGAAAAVSIVYSAASPLNVWRLWFAACTLGIVTVVPLIVAVPQAVRAPLPRRESVEGIAGLAVLAGLSAVLISLPDGPWAAALPESLIFPILLWIAIRCRPVFAAGAAFVVTLVIIGSTILGIGHFGQASLPIADRVLAAQTFVLAAAILVLLLSALFVERRRTEAALKASTERLQLALDGARLGAFSADLATGRIEFDARATRLHGYDVPPTTIRESRRFVHPDDLERIDAAVVEARCTGGMWRAEYRVIASFGPAAEETRWIALEGSVEFDGQGKSVGLRGVMRDITRRKRSEQALAERDTQLALAGKDSARGLRHIRSQHGEDACFAGLCGHSRVA